MTEKKSIAEKKRVQIKEALAKLMATENITVEHVNVPSAAFDVVNRKLYLPLWKNISEDVYTLLISHEVGHALYTPGEDWKQKVLEGKDINYKNVVNIIEDVRIEKLIQQKYPGTVRQFRSGYSELEKQNLFGTRSDDKKIDEYGILDRINMHYKVGHFGFAEVNFKPEEKHWLSKIDACKTFEDVLKLSEQLLKYAESQPEYQPQEVTQSDVIIEAGSEEEAEALKKLLEQGSDNSKGAESITIQYPKSSPDGEEGQSPQESSDSKEEQSNSDSEKQNNKSSGQKQIASVRSITQDTFDNKMQQFIDLDNTVVTVNIPKMDMKKVIVDYPKILKQLSSYYSGNSVQMARARECLINFRTNNRHVVNQMVNLFEMKKRAKTDARIKISKTGILDTNKVHGYKYNEDIFRKVANIPVGKSHGLVVFMDMSGSMSNHMTGSYAQMINLALFCRKINIPFEIYGFTDTTFSKTDSYSPSKNVGEHKLNNIFIPGNFSLRNYLSSRMSLTEFNEMMEYLMCIMSHYTSSKYSYDNNFHCGLPFCERLGGTPLNETIISAMQIVPEFQTAYKLDIVNTVIITDGDGTSGLSYYEKSEYSTTDSYQEKSLNYMSGEVFCRFRDSKKMWHLTHTDAVSVVSKMISYRDFTSNLIQMYKDITATKLIGFYICDKSTAKNMLSSPYHTKVSAEESKKLQDDFESKNFAEIKKDGYDTYYVIPAGKDLLTSGEEIEFGETNSKNIIHKRFLKAMSKKKNSRILLGRFIDHIS